MDREKAAYIRHYFSHLMTDDEQSALRYHMYTYKTSHNPEMRKLLIEKGWISTDPKIAAFLKHGYGEFELNVATRIMAETPEKVFFNNCPACGKLPRTPYAKQCRYCGHSWREI
ncbi:MAG: hypothetical protein LBE92_12025 [Chryseobacterium sp.]|jgi:hypothetical protein|uniref:hypothetical protein n=1 Tax=Chryseobacterium sp. TaxID=1871047 RepID=UPI00282FDC55|nr:hypothetical protein [Chryseobacterium sp.]MDR2236842.1 hypothetical protein [Chryseobacterium sp.]